MVRTLGRLLIAALLASGSATAFASEVGTSTGSGSRSGKTAADIAEAAAQLYKAEKFRAALELFQSAYELDPRPSLLFNQAKCHERLAEWDEALSAYQRYLDASPDAANKGEVQKRLAEIKKTKGNVESNYLAKMNAGRKAYADGDYEGAIAAFDQAFKIRRAPAPIYNTAQCYEKMARYEQAIEALDHYLELSPNAPDRADVDERIRRLKKSISDRYQELSVTSTPPGADVYLDDPGAGIRGQTELRLKVPPGRHTLFLESNGFEPVKKEFVMPDDQPLRLQFQLNKLERVGFLEVKVNRAGVRIFVDGAIVGLSPFTQKWILTEGQHQVLVESEDYRRLAQNVVISMNKTVRASFKFRSEEEGEESEGSDFSFWGETLVLGASFVAIAGIAGPVIYEKASLGRNPYSYLGPAQAMDQGPYYRGPTMDPSAQRSNGTLKTLQGIQIGSIIGASVLGAGGLTFLAIHLFGGGRSSGDDATVTGVGTPVSKEGAFLQISGRF